MALDIFYFLSRPFDLSEEAQETESSFVLILFFFFRFHYSDTSSTNSTADGIYCRRRRKTDKKRNKGAHGGWLSESTVGTCFDAQSVEKERPLPDADRIIPTKRIFTACDSSPFPFHPGGGQGRFVNFLPLHPPPHVTHPMHNDGFPIKAGKLAKRQNQWSGSVFGRSADSLALRRVNIILHRAANVSLFEAALKIECRIFVELVFHPKRP